MAAQQAHRKSSVQRRNNLLRNGRREASAFIFSLLSVLCEGVCGLDNNITCSPGEVYHPHHHLLLPPPNTHTYTHCTYPAMQRLILTSVIFTETLRESNHESSVWKPECSLFCWAVLLDSTPQHSCTHRPHATHSDIKSSLQIGDARQTENTNTLLLTHTDNMVLSNFV